MNRLFDYYVADARKVHDAAHVHEAALVDIGATRAEIDKLKSLSDAVNDLISTRDAVGTSIVAAVEAKMASFDEALNLAMNIRRRARVIAAKPGTKNTAIARACGVNGRVPSGIGALERLSGSIAKAFADKNGKKLLSSVGVTAPMIADLEKRVAAVQAAMQEKRTRDMARRRTSSNLEKSMRDMKALTTYLREAGNAAFNGMPEEKDFDHPPKPGKKKHAAKTPVASGAGTTTH